MCVRVFVIPLLRIKCLKNVLISLSAFAVDLPTLVVGHMFVVIVHGTSFPFA